MILTTIAALALAPAYIQSPPPLSCPVGGHEVTATSLAYDYRGIRYRLCCADCKPAFEKDPDGEIKKPDNKGLVLGASLFDPISGRPVNGKSARGYSDFEGVRYYFGQPANKRTFDADPKKYATQPEKEVLYCPVLDIALTNYYGSNGFVDHAGMRIYSCCAMCFGVLRNNAAKYAAAAARNVTQPKPLAVPPEIAKLTGGLR